MGFQFHAIKLPKAISITIFLEIFTTAFIAALSYLGLYKPPPSETPNSPPNYILMLDGASPSLVPVAVHVVTAAIKARVPVLRYREIAGEESERFKVCTICLDLIEGEHEVRDLCNCRHLFHRECLDTWIDEGQVSCPLCRSMLLPTKVDLIRCSRVQLNNAELVSY